MKPCFHLTGILFVATIVSMTGCVLKSSTTNTTDNTSTAANTNAGQPEATPLEAGAETQAALPETLVADLYKQHDAQKSPFFQTKNRALVDKYFAKPLADLIWKDATTSAGTVGAIDADPLYYAQDVEIKNLAVGKGDIKNDKATVRVTFTNYGEKKTITFALISAGNSWRIENISYGENDNLLKWLRDTYSAKPEKETSSSGEFKGKYTVGPTTCTVKPVKMAFEVRWAKGSGAEVFAFKDGTTFESSADGGGNRFVFDDEDYNTGTFYRSDGKTFQVRRAE